MTVLRVKFQTAHIASGVPTERLHHQVSVVVSRATLALLVQVVYAHHVQAAPSLAFHSNCAHRVLQGLSPMAPDVQGVHCQRSLLTTSTVLQLVMARGLRMTKVARRRAHCVGPA